MLFWQREKEGKQRGERQLSNNNSLEPTKLRDIPEKLYYLHLCLPRAFRSSINLSGYRIYWIYNHLSHATSFITLGSKLSTNFLRPDKNVLKKIIKIWINLLHWGCCGDFQRPFILHLTIYLVMQSTNITFVHPLPCLHVGGNVRLWETSDSQVFGDYSLSKFNYY